MDINTSVVIQETLIFSLQETALYWLETKFRKTNSEKTRKAYQVALTKFDLYLQERGYKLDGNPRVIGRHAQAWANTPEEKEKVSSSTVNQRLAILSSFYKFAIKQGLCEHNPIDYVERPKNIIKHAASYMDSREVTKRIKAIDTVSLEGKRDKALLSLALTTGRRASELANLRWQDITVTSYKMMVTWVRCKGAKVMLDELKAKTAESLLDYLRALYGAKLEHIKPESPIFVSLSHNNHGGKLSIQALSDIYKARLGTSQVHITRHTFAVNMERSGASLSEIGEALGHSNYAVTARYMKQLHSGENKYGDALEEMFGI
jgi:site-specific recombinase XerD